MKIQLRSHSDLSIIDGIIAAENIPKIAKEKGYDCIALTDLMNMFGFVKFYKNCLKNKIKPILGVELLLNNNEFGDYKILMLAKNNKGLVNIFELITNAYTKYKDLFLGEIKIPDDFILSKKNKIHDVFILSGGIYSEYVNIIQQDKELALKERLLLWKSIYENDYFIELQKVQTIKYHINILNKKMYQLATDLNIKVVATHPIYFNETQDYIPHQIKKCNIEKIKLDKNNIESLNQEYTYDMYFLDANEFSSRFNEIQEEVTTNLNYIKDNCNVELRLGVADLPEFPIPKNETIESYFKKIAIDGLKSRLKEIFPNENDYKQNEKIYFERLNYELETIIQMKFPGYFLIVADFINWAKENDIPVGAGRGSGAGSLVAYSLKITDINPIPYDLLFERFLNPERVSMPDFDIDFCQEKRGLVIDYVTNKYGKECVSQIATFGTMASKAVINDVVRVLNYPYNLGASLTKRIPFGYNLESAYNEDNDLQALADKDEEVKDIWDNALKLEGLARSIGKHAAGVVIAPSKISDYCPLYQTEGNQTSQLDKVDVEDVGLVKFDFLGLKNLTIIHDTLQMIKNQKNIEVKLDTQKFNDIETFKILQDGNTTGIFQVESSGMKSYLVKMQPDCFEDIIAMLALYRPGPLGSGMVDDFIKRKRWEKNGKPDPQNTINFSDKYQVSNYFVPALEDCLKPTYGIIVYQEQVMKISQIIAGYSLGGADLLRRCISGDSNIMLENGEVKTVKEIYEDKNNYIHKNITSLNENNKKNETDKITNIYYNGKKLTYKVKTKLGKEIKVTNDHLFYTIDGWKQLKNLKSGSFIATSKYNKIENNISHSLSAEKIKLIAYILGDGCISGKNCYFCNSDEELIDDFINSYKKIFGNCFSIAIQKKQNLKNITYIHLNGEGKKWIKEYLLDKKSADKFIPTEVFKLNDEFLKLFIGTLWNTDGSFDKSIGHCDYNSKSKKLIEQLNSLLLRFSIVAKKEERILKYNNKPFYRSQITGKIDFFKFYKNFYCFLSKKNQKYSNTCLMLLNKKIETFSKHCIPNEILKYILESKYRSRKSWKELGLTNLISGLNLKTPNGKRKINLNKFKKIASLLNDNELIKLSNSDIFWDEIVSIEEFEIEEIFDLEIETNHNFYANDILVHNCMGKKKPEEMAQQRSIFLEGAEKNGYSNEIANHLFDLMESFAEYGFNKSHSAAYAVITYHTAFLKRHYLAYFMSATMSSDMNNLEHLEILINDAKDNNLEIVNPDINKSDYKFQPINDTTIIYSFGALKGITEQSAKQIVEERTKNGFYKDINDFLDRCFEFIDKKILLALVCSGCFDSLNVSRKSIFENIDSIIKQKRKLQKTKNTASLFENYELSNFALSLSDEKWNINYQLEKEFDIIGFHLTDNLFKKYNKYKIYNEYLSPVDFKNKSEDELIDLKSQSRNFKICGIIKEHKMGTGAFLVIYDYSHKIKLYFSDSALTSYKIHQEELITNAFVVLNVNFSFKNIDEEIRVSFYINDILEIK